LDKHSKNEDIHIVFLGLAWNIWGIVGLVLAVVFVFIAPREQGKMSRRKFMIIRWFHSLVWLLLAISFFLRGIENTVATTAADVVAVAGGLVYTVYLDTTIRE
jgi:hypothetical protein